MTAGDGDELFVWQELHDGKWGVIASGMASLDPMMALLMGDGLMPLLTRDEEVAYGELMSEIARRHHEASGHPIRLARFRLDVVARTLG